MFIDDTRSSAFNYNIRPSETYKKETNWSETETKEENDVLHAPKCLRYLQAHWILVQHNFHPKKLEKKNFENRE